MIESYYAGVYWSDRRESTGECARRAETFFRLMARCDPVFTRWFEQAETREEALQLQFAPTYEGLLRLFGKKDYQLDGNGICFSAWTGQAEDGHGSMLLLSCGSAAEWTPNSCLLYLPREAPEASRVLTLPVLSAVMRAMVLAWEPDWGLIAPRDLRDALRQEKDERKPVGWLTYFSPRRSPLPPLPQVVRVEPLEDKGTLVILTPDCLSSTNPEHVALAQRVVAVLDERNLLAPVVYPPRRPPLTHG